MIDKKLQYARQMYAMGQRVGGIMGSNNGSMLVTPTRDGSRPGYYGPDAGHENDPGHGSNAPDGGNDGDGSSNREKGIMSQYSGPKGTTGNINDFTGDKDGVDRSAVNQFSTYGRNKFNQNLKGPSVFSRIGTGIGNYIKGGGLIGMGIRGLTGLFGGPTTKDTTAPDQRNMFNVSGPVVGPDFGDGDGDGQGIMNLYNPNMLNVSGKVEEEVPVSKEEEDFKQRYRVANEFRQDKQGQLDPAILEMISKLYT